jgi:hypothetical protein
MRSVPNMNQFKVIFEMNSQIKTTRDAGPFCRLALLMLLQILFLGLGFSQVQAQGNLPPGDWIINSKTGNPEPFYPNHKKSDFVKDCENSPGIEKNLRQIGRFIPTAIMGNDGRCPFFFDENSSEEDKALFGVGEIGDYSRKCRAKGGGICTGTGHLVMDGDIVITAAHVFLNHIDGEIDKYSDGKGFKFSTKVWIPKELRQDPDVAYEGRNYEIESIQYGSLNPRDPDHKDYAFVKLKEPVGVSVGKRDANGKIGKKVAVDRKYWPKPLAFKPLDDTRFSRKIEMVSLRDENGKIKDSPFYKNCEPFNIYRDPHSDLGPAVKNLLILDGDTLDRSSGSALAVRDEQGVLTFTGINVSGQILPTETETEGDFHIENRRNFAIDGNSFYEEFINFRKKFGRRELKKNSQATGSI